MVCKLWPIPSLPYSNSWDGNFIQTGTTINRGLPLCPAPSQDSVLWQGIGHQHFSSFPSYLLLKLNFGRQWTRSGAPFFCPVPTYRMKYLFWVWHCLECWGTDHPCPGLWGDKCTLGEAAQEELKLLSIFSSSPS